MVEPLAMGTDERADELKEPTHAGPAHMCLACGYALNGLPREAACPECSAPVARSLRGSMLEYADRGYVSTLLWGSTIAIVGLFAGFAWIVAIPLILTLAAKYGSVSTRGGFVLVQVVEFAGAGISLLGWWLLSSPDPVMQHGSVRDTVSDVRARRLLRACLIYSAIGSLAGLIVMVTPLSSTPFRALSGNITLGPNTQWNPALLSSLVLRGSFLLVKFAGFFIGLVYLRSLSTRIPSPIVHRSAGRLMWQVPLWGTVGIACFGLGPVIALVLYAIMLFRVRFAIAAVRARMPKFSIGD